MNTEPAPRPDSPAAAATPRTQTTFWSVLRTDIIPGRGRRWKESITNAGLPAQLAMLCESVVTKTKLRRSEKADVACELVAHFQDGLAAGRSPQELARDFGDARESAVLIRRAVKRKRSLAWHAWIRIWQAVAVLLCAAVVLYSALLARIFLSKPTISRNFTAEYNARLKDIPESDRAWPLYEKAFSLLQPPPKAVIDSREYPAIAPGNPAWEATVEFNKANQPALKALRLAAGAKKFDSPISDVPAPFLVEYERRLSEARGMPEQKYDAPRENPPLYSVQLPQLGWLRNGAHQLQFDAFLAMDSGDSNRVCEDLNAMRGIADHLAQQGFMIGDLVSLAVFALHNSTVRAAVCDHPGLLSDAQLVEIAHATAAYPNGLGKPRVDLEAEAGGFEDVLQRVYTDDGHGDGHTTRDGLKFLSSLIDPNDQHGVSDAQAFSLGVALASRAEVRNLWRRMFDHAQRLASVPLWERTERADDEFDRLIHSSKLNRARYALASVLMPALGHMINVSEIAIMERDGTLTGIALELFKRHTGAYPASLDALVPHYLPAVPPDRFDGKPVRYKLVDGKPLLYSIAADYEDNGGMTTGQTNMPGRWMPRAQYMAMPPNERKAARLGLKSDWILWPDTPERKGFVPPTEEPQPDVGAPAAPAVN